MPSITLPEQFQVPFDVFLLTVLWVPCLVYMPQANGAHTDTTYLQASNPGKSKSGIGVDKSLPIKREYSRKSLVTSMQTV